MNVRVKAAIDIVTLVGVSALVALAVVFILETVPIQTISWALGISCFSFILYIFWSIRVSQLELRASKLEHEKTMSSINSKRTTV
jgi:hypothetical protein